MRPEKVEIFVDGLAIDWTLGRDASPLTVKENQQIRVKIYFGSAGEVINVPRLDVEDHSIQLHRDEYQDAKGSRAVNFSSYPEKIFRESFGIAVLRLYVEDEEFAIAFEVLATKVRAIQAERMIRYLAERREKIIRVCLSRTMRQVGMRDVGQSDPETIISTAEKIIDIFLDSQGELRQHIRSKLVPSKVPAWKADQSGSLIDPVDVIFNLDSLRPGDGRQDVVLRGRTYSTSAIDVTALIRDPNVEENAILIGGLYSIFRVISGLMDEIDAAFKGHQIAAYDKEYVSLGEMIIKLTGGAMYERCGRVIYSAENLIRMLENNFGIKFSGEIHPRITPYVRSSRLYRNIFENYSHWYELGSPNIDDELFLIKLRSLAKIFEFFVLFRLFDYFTAHGWQVKDFSLSEKLDKLVPDVMIFEKGEADIVLSYEPNNYKFSESTQHMELVKLDHPEHSGGYWTPDYTICFRGDASGCAKYLILDAKYSNPYLVEKFHIKKIYSKYYDYMAVFNESRHAISRDEILGVFAIFPEPLDQAPKIVNMRLAKFGIDGRGPILMPMVAGLPIAFGADNLMEKWLDKAIERVMHSLPGSKIGLV
jgi:hypothetical protein